jgi:hypothetical protein
MITEADGKGAFPSLTDSTFFGIAGWVQGPGNSPRQHTDTNQPLADSGQWSRYIALASEARSNVSVFTNRV